ncbi:MAG: hydrogenase formation protein HypD [Chitinivibrionales bacterium]|nr:hydrogenase formation protein HypD [Chitinivibrionales bacterium]MBD3356287.1 hydrogenase formation protein HypD [Chitinivibrionales bacterium]
MIPHDFSKADLAVGLLAGIKRYARRCDRIKIMEVCGTHTMEIGRHGIRGLLPERVELVSGPGCPVCVTPGALIDAAADTAIRPGVTVLVFGDMIRVPGNRTSLREAKSRGGSVEVVVSPLRAVSLARENPNRIHVFVAVGFETTVPAVARSVILAEENGVDNLYFIACHRLVPPVLKELLNDLQTGLSAFLLPGHVSAIIGVEPYGFVVNAGIPAAIAGFEPLDILGAIHSVSGMVAERRAGVENWYSRVVRPGGNPHARRLMERVFVPVDAFWRGIGMIPGSGLAFCERYRRFDAVRKLGIEVAEERIRNTCRCGEVLKGRIRPSDCALFAETCTPQSPQGPCMVSSEGSCAAYYKYELR